METSKLHLPCETKGVWTSKVVSVERWQADAETVLGPFTEYLQRCGYAAFMVHKCGRRLLRVARQLANQGRSLDEVTRIEVPRLSRGALRGRDRLDNTMQAYRAALRHWLKFKGKFDSPPPCAHWTVLLDDFVRFLVDHRGASVATCRLSRYFVYDYLTWQYGRRPLEWSRVRAADLWRYAADFARRFKAVTVKRGLSALRSFFSFLHLRGHCSSSFKPAVPAVPVRGPRFDPGVLSAAQRRRLLAECRRHRTEGLRNQAMVLLMIDLGLRRCEVVDLQLTDFDRSGGTLTVPAAKSEHTRLLPVPAHLAVALNDYLRHERPPGSAEAFFVRNGRRRGQPVTRALLGSLTQRLCRRCKLPHKWTGTHRLRHTFATRLFSHGASLKELADLLGHRSLETSRGYAHVDLQGLRRVARPWPL